MIKSLLRISSWHFQDKGRTRKQGEANINQGRVGSSGYNEITCKYRITCMISLLDLVCMVHACVYLVLLMSLPWLFLGVTVIFSLALSF